MHFNFMTGFLCPFGPDNTHTRMRRMEPDWFMYIIIIIIILSFYLSPTHTHAHAYVLIALYIYRCYKYRETSKIFATAIAEYYITTTRRHSYNITIQYRWYYIIPRYLILIVDFYLSVCL